MVMNEGGGKHMEQWITWIPEVGFPILVTFYLLHRIDHRLKELNESLLKLPLQMEMYKK